MLRFSTHSLTITPLYILVNRRAQLLSFITCQTILALTKLEVPDAYQFQRYICFFIFIGWVFHTIASSYAISANKRKLLYLDTAKRLSTPTV